MKTKIMTLAVIGVLASVTWSGPVCADMSWETETVILSLQQDNAQIKTSSKVYFSDHAYRLDMDTVTIVIDFISEMITRVNWSQNTYEVLPVREFGKPKQFENMTQEKLDQFKRLLETFLRSAEIVPLGETRQIGPYMCAGYEIKYPMVNTQVWATRQVDGYDQMRLIGHKLDVAVRENPFLKSLNSLSNFAGKVDGVPVLTVTNTEGGRTVTRVRNISTKKLSADVFTMPELSSMSKKNEVTPSH